MILHFGSITAYRRYYGTIFALRKVKELTIILKLYNTDYENQTVSRQSAY